MRELHPWSDRLLACRPQQPDTLLYCCVLIASTLLLNVTVLGQSGRRQQQTGKSPVPTATPTAPTDGKKTSDKSTAGPATTFIVGMDDNLFLNLPNSTIHVVYGGFVARLEATRSVVVVAGGKSDRKRSRDRAKTETDAHVVLLQVEEDAMGRGSGGGQVDLASLVVKYFVYVPATGAVKLQGSVPIRPYRPAASVGGVRLPIPMPTGGVNSFELVLEQAGRDAADALLSRFHIRLPTEPWS